MKFIGRRASTYGNDFEIKINSLKELINFIDENGSIIIEKCDDEYELIIYDDYIE